jgi:hypothetical protein
MQLTDEATSIVARVPIRRSRTDHRASLAWPRGAHGQAAACDEDSAARYQAQATRLIEHIYKELVL